jgi:hypothetical protein
MALLLFLRCRGLRRKGPPGVVGIGVARLPFFGERAHAFLTVFGAGYFQHGFQLLLIAFVAAVPFPINFYQPLSVMYREIVICSDFTGEAERLIEMFLIEFYVI